MHVYLHNNDYNDHLINYSNQVKGYDYIFIPGEGDENIYLNSIIKIDPNKFIKTGRPHLDLIKPIKLETFKKKIVMYLPNIETAGNINDITLTDAIVDTLLNDSNYFLIYRSPNLHDIQNKNILTAYQKIFNKVKSHPYALNISNYEINNIFPIVDCTIFDILSVSIDYLNFNKPLIIAESTQNIYHKKNSIFNTYSKITQNNISTLQNIIYHEITNDPMKDNREILRNLYLGNFKKGESLKKFINSVSSIIKHRDQEVHRKIKEKVYG
jgi:hypothetical protein